MKALPPAYQHMKRRLFAQPQDSGRISYTITTLRVMPPVLGLPLRYGLLVPDRVPRTSLSLLSPSMLFLWSARSAGLPAIWMQQRRSTARLVEVKRRWATLRASSQKARHRGHTAAPATNQVLVGAIYATFWDVLHAWSVYHRHSVWLA